MYIYIIIYVHTYTYIYIYIYMYICCISILAKPLALDVLDHSILSFCTIVWYYYYCKGHKSWHVMLLQSAPHVRRFWGSHGESLQMIRSACPLCNPPRTKLEQPVRTAVFYDIICKMLLKPI